METNTKLTMSFKSQEGSKVSLNVNNPKAGLTAEEVSTVMDHLIDADAFDMKGGLREKVYAEVTRTTKERLF